MAAESIELRCKINKAYENLIRGQQHSVRCPSSVREQTSPLLGFAFARRSNSRRTHPSVYRSLENSAVLSARLLACSSVLIDIAHRTVLHHSDSMRFSSDLAKIGKCKLPPFQEV